MRMKQLKKQAWQRIRKMGFTLLSVVGLMGIPVSSMASEKSTRPHSLVELEAHIQQIMQREELVGAVAAVVEDGQLIWSQGFGLADKESGRLVAADTPFRAGSISKTLVTLMVMHLVEQGKLSLQDKLSDLAPEIVVSNPFEEQDPIRLVHLLEHTSGIDDLHFSEFVINEADISLGEALAVTSKSRVSRWPPGSIYSYSNSGPMIAAYIIEKITGASFYQSVREQFLAPLGMERTTFKLDERVKQDLAKSYGELGQLPVPYRHILSPPAGGLNTTVGDLAKLMTLYLHDGEVDGKRLLSAASIRRTEQAESSQAAKLGQTDGYAMGNQRSHAFGQIFHGHMGGIDGFSGEFGYLRGRDRGYIMILNTPNYQGYQDVLAALQAYVTRDLRPIEVEKVQRDESELAPHEGYYLAKSLRFEFMRIAARLGPGIMKIELLDGELVASNLFGGDVRKLIPVGESGFRFEDDYGATLYFQDVGNEHLLLGENSFSRISASVVWFIPLLIFCAFMLLLSSLFYALVWVPKAVMGKYPHQKAILLRLWPLAGSIALLTGLIALIMLFSAPYPDIIFNALGAPSTTSALIFLSTIAFPALAVVGLFTCWYASTSEVGAVARCYAALVSVALLILAIYFAAYGWLGMQTWNY